MSIPLKSKKKQKLLSCFISFATAFPGALDGSGTPGADVLRMSVTLLPPLYLVPYLLLPKKPYNSIFGFHIKFNLEKQQISLVRQILKNNETFV